MKAEENTEILDPLKDARISRETKKFLNVLNSPAPPELEKMSPEEARKVLEGAQASVNVIIRESKNRRRQFPQTVLKSF